MTLELVEVGTSAGIGIIDNILVELEERGSITGNLTCIKDAIRIVGAFGGLIVNYTIARPGTTLDKVSGALGISALPLAMHSIRKLMKGVMKSSYGGGWVLEAVRSAEQQVPVQPGTPAVITSY